MKLEDVLPALREGKRIRRNKWDDDLWVRLQDAGLVDDSAESFEFNGTHTLADDWEIVPEPTRVADFLVPDSFSMTVSGKCSHWVSKTYPIGQHPEGSVMIPGSERNAAE